MSKVVLREYRTAVQQRQENLSSRVQRFYTIPSMEISEWIKEARALRDLTQAQLGEYLGVSKANVSGWENGRHSPSYAQLLNISIVTGKALPHTANQQENPADDIRASGLLRWVHVSGSARVGADGSLEVASTEASGSLGRINVTVSDPGAYAIQVKGQALFPGVRDSWFLVVSPRSPLVEGEFVLMAFQDGRTVVKELMYRRTGTFEVANLNGGERQIVELRSLTGVHPICAMVAPSQWRDDHAEVTE